MEDVETAVREFLAGLATAFGTDDSPVLNVSDGVIEASLPSREGLMIGPRGVTLDAIQELTRVTAQRAAPSSTRIRVDVGGYRAARAEALANFARKAAARVREEGNEVVLEPMTSPDRKIVHDALLEEAGVSTRSVGEDPRRRVVIMPQDGEDSSAAPSEDGEESIAAADSSAAGEEE